MSHLEQHEPSSCDCDQCLQTCHTLPGTCAPGDIERIAEHLGMGEEFIREHFQPVTGPTVEYWGEPVNVPVIRPVIRDGKCVFLQDERCGIHAVRPFGCAMCNACQGGNPAADEACLRAIAEDIEYLDLWCALVYDQPIDA
jgi:Fe-S-cluster containining protein